MLDESGLTVGKWGQGNWMKCLESGAMNNFKKGRDLLVKGVGTLKRVVGAVTLL